MQDVVIAGTFTLVGAMASGATQVVIAVRVDRRKTRGAKREVLYELTELTAALLIVESGDPEFAAALQATVLPGPAAFQKHRSLLAQGLRKRQWAAVQVAYARYEMVRGGVTSTDEVAHDFARDHLVASTIEDCATAVAALTPRRQRADDARGLQELRNSAERVSARRGPGSGTAD